MENRDNHRLNVAIEQFVDDYDGTAIGQAVKTCTRTAPATKASAIIWAGTSAIMLTDP